MGEILKKEQVADRPEGRSREDEDGINPRLRVRLSQVDFVSPLGAFRASEGNPELRLAPNNAVEIWRDWREDLDRRLAQTAFQTERLLAEVARN